MSLKSIVEVDVQDEKFREFQALYEKYEQALAATPDKWRRVKQGTDEAASAWAKWDKQGRVVVSAGYNQGGKPNLPEMARARDLAQATAFHWKGLAADGRSFFNSIDGATKQITKWSGLSGVLGGALAAGGLLGLARSGGGLAQGVAEARRQSMATGVPFGSQRAFTSDYSRFVDTDSMLGNIAEARSDATSAQYRGLLAAGLKPDQIKGRDAADLGVEVLHQLPKLFPKGADDPLLGTRADALGITSITDIDSIKRYLRAAPEERQQQDSTYLADKRGLSINGPTLRAWADLNNQISRAGSEIEVAFIKGLAPLAPEFTDLSKGVVKLVDDFVGSKEIKDDLDGLAKGLGAFDRWINDPNSLWNRAGSFLNGVAKAEKDAGDATHKWIMGAAPWLNPSNIDWYSGGNALTHHAAKRGHYFTDRENNEPDFQSKADARLRAFGGHPKGSGGGAPGTPEGAARGHLGSGYTGRGDLGRVSKATLANGDESFAFWRSKGLSAEAAAGLVGMEQGEALNNPADKSGDGGNAHGSFQWHADRRANIRAATGIDIDRATHQQQLEAAYWEMTRSNDAGARHAWDMVNRPGITAGQAAAAGTTYFERPADKPGQSIVRGKFAQGWLDRESKSDAAAGAAPQRSPWGAPPKPFAPAVGDQAALDARNRLALGRGTDADRELERRYREQQNRPTMHPDDDRASRARGFAGPYAVKGHLSPVQYTKGGGANPLTDLYGSGLLHSSARDQMRRDVAKAAEGLSRRQVAPEQTIDHKLHRVLEKLAARHSGLSDNRFQQKKMPHVLVQNNTGANVHVSAAMAAFG